MAIKKESLKIKRLKAPSFAGDEAYLRLGVSDNEQTDGTAAKTCDQFMFKGNFAHNRKGRKYGKMC